MNHTLKRFAGFRIYYKSLITSIRLPDKLRGGRIEKLAEYLKQVGYDYRQSFVDIVQDSRQRPVRATIIGSLVVGFIYLVKTNPDETDFQLQMIAAHNNLSEIAATVRNGHSYEHVMQLNQLVNEGVVRRLSLGPVSFMYRSDFNRSCSLFEAQCKYLKNRSVTEFARRVVDVGIAGRWWLLDRAMVDFDVNAEEWHSVNT